MERNPYLILGIPYGASRDAANIAFARRSRALRRQGLRGGERMTDLTWALNQIDEAETDPGAAVGVYRIPATPAVFESGPGVLAPPPEALPGRGGDRDTAFHRLHAAAVHDYLRFLVATAAPRLDLPEP
ncbi:MAG TPA: hypothetical protein VFV01_18735 [Spirillospora sp.]|nr:hypothetical protein [Spirillospora sp.]